MRRNNIVDLVFWVPTEKAAMLIPEAPECFWLDKESPNPVRFALKIWYDTNNLKRFMLSLQHGKQKIRDRCIDQERKEEIAKRILDMMPEINALQIA